MALQDLGRGHWIAIGLALGLAMGGIQELRRPDIGQGTGCVLTQGEFEAELLSVDQKGRPKLTDMVIHPPDADQRSWIVGRRFHPLSPDSRSTSDSPRRQEIFRFAAAFPYRRLGDAAREGRSAETVQAYLDRIKAAHPEAAFTYQYAWWEQTRYGLLIWGMGGILVIGGLWPTLLRIMVGAGLAGPSREPRYDLDRFTHEPEPAVAEPATVNAELVAEKEQELLEALAAEPSHSDEPAPCKPAAPVLDNAPLAILPVAPEAIKHYTGEFYPVARRTRLDSDEQTTSPLPPPPPESTQFPQEASEGACQKGGAGHG